MEEGEPTPLEESADAPICSRRANGAIEIGTWFGRVKFGMVGNIHVMAGGRELYGARLESKGYGKAKPAADNGTPEGRQQYRRVELVRL